MTAALIVAGMTADRRKADKTGGPAVIPADTACPYSRLLLDLLATVSRPTTTTEKEGERRRVKRPQGLKWRQDKGPVQEERPSLPATDRPNSGSALVRQPASGPAQTWP
uniref:Uncharacterized protein n=1 Tax=Thermogemmatispora argillosa TaxID=2045280 RepID=A0A455T052_9CHLR|nr:hypothetical protein KTA_07510 [Thermogemmatispora argillosa]